MTNPYRKAKKHPITNELMTNEPMTNELMTNS